MIVALSAASTQCAPLKLHLLSLALLDQSPRLNEHCALGQTHSGPRGWGWMVCVWGGGVNIIFTPPP
jgi:hypothetical protein